MLAQEELLECLQGCKNNDRGSQKKIYASFYGFAMSVCFKYVKSKEEATEVVNDGFLKIFKELFQLPASPDAVVPTFTAWVKRIMINTAIDHYRKNKKLDLFSELGDGEEDRSVVAENGLEKMAHDEIMAAVHTLPPGYKLVFCLHVLEGMSHKEVAAQLNITEGTSKSNLAKARAVLQKALFHYSR